jgi:hypothetical protein
MPLQATSGAATYDAFGGGVPAVPNYIEDVFSTYLYTGNSTTQAITNGIDLSTKGGLVWIKPRNQVQDHVIFDTVGGITKSLASNNTSAQYTATAGNEGLASFNTTGFTAKLFQNSTGINNSACNLVSWTFRKQPKFFDVQTFTYPASGSITVAHNLESTPGCVMVKATNGVDNWYVYHRMVNNGTNPSNYILQLNTTSAQINNFASWITVGSSSITFPSGALNPGSNYVMYLFAHNAGGFGLTGTDNVISCGSFVSDGSGNATVTLGYEPQWLLTKQSSGAGGQQWYVVDTMRGWSLDTGTDVALKPNTDQVESAGDYGTPTATGFTQTGLNASATHIYIAIRRGPMKVPTLGTSVYTMALINSASANNTNFATSGFPVDLWMTITATDPFADPFLWMPRLTTLSLASSSTNAESGNPYTNMKFDGNTGIVNRTGTTGSTSLTPNWMFQRSPSFFDVVCYTGDTSGGSQIVAHNLTVTPELIIIKSRSNTSSWEVGQTNWAFQGLNNTNSGAATTLNATSSTFDTGIYGLNNTSGYTYVAYLFATCAGVSKVGSYAGTGATQTINCGFTGGARFVMIKRANSTGGWYVWDTTRGMVSGTDPSKLWNTSAAQVNANSVFTITTGFQIVSTAAEINASGGTYIFLAIA